MENEREKKPIRNFKDLEVYNRLYTAMKIVMKEITPQLPKEERYDLADQLNRSCKAGPALIAEGFAKRYQKRSWKKYIEDTIGESNEMIHHLSVCIDIYPQFIDVETCQELIREYDIANRQLYRLKLRWTDFHKDDK